MSKLKTHWVADIFPLNQSDVESIAEDIKENGQELPIHVLEDGRVVDGRNRWLACQKAGVEPRTVTIPNVDGEPPSDDELLRLSTTLNGRRRQLKPGQRAAAAAEAYAMICRQEGVPKGGRGKTDDKLSAICTQFKSGERNLKNALTLLRNDRERFELIRGGAPVDSTYKDYQEVKQERKRMQVALDLIERFPEIDREYQSGEIDFAEAKMQAGKAAKEEKEKEDEEVKSRRAFTLKVYSAYELAHMIGKCGAGGMAEKFSPEDVGKCGTGKQPTKKDIAHMANIFAEFAKNL